MRVPVGYIYPTVADILLTSKASNPFTSGLHILFSKTAPPAFTQKMAHRAKKSGLGADIERKMEESYDKEEKAGTPQAVVTWINAVLENTPGVAPCPGSAYNQIATYLKDGTILCKFINKLMAADDKPNITFTKKASSPFVAMANIAEFGKACETYGVNKEFLFQSNDLYEGKKGPMLNVINSLHSLGFVANSKMFIPAYTGQQTKYVDQDDDEE